MLRRRIAVNIAFFVNGFVFASWVSRLPRIQDLYAIDNGTTGLVLLASSIGAVGAMPFAGWVIIRNGSQKITLLAALSYCIVVTLIPVMPGILALVSLFFLMGIANGMLDVAMNAQAILVEQEYRRSIITSFHALFSIGMMLGAAAGAIFSKFDYGLTQHLIITNGASLVSLLWMSQNLVRDHKAEVEQDTGPLFRLPNKSLVSIGIIAFCCMISEGAISDWSVNYMENIVGSDDSTAAIGLSAFATAMTLGRLLGDRARTKLGDRRMILGGGITAVMGMLLAVLVLIEYWAITGFFLVGIGLSTIIPIAYSIAGNERDLPSGVGLAMVTTVGYSGFLIGPPLIGFVADLFSLRIALVVITLLLLAMTLLGIWYKPSSTTTTFK